MAEKAAIDKSFGPGTWDDWRILQKDQQAQENEASGWDTLFSFGKVYDVTRNDLILMEMIGDDFGEGLQSVDQKRSANPAQVANVKYAWQCSIALMKADNELIAAIKKTGLAGLISAIGIEDLKRKARDAKAELQNLKKALEAAKSNQSKAEYSGMFDAGITFIGLVFPELTIIEKLELGTLQYLVGGEIGANNSAGLSAAQTDATYAGLGLTAMEGVKRLSAYKQNVSSAGSMVTVVGLALDIKAIEDAKADVEFFTKILKKAQDSLDALLKEIDKRVKQFPLIKGVLKGLETGPRKNREAALVALRTALPKAGYSADGSSFAWW